MVDNDISIKTVKFLLSLFDVRKMIVAPLDNSIYSKYLKEEEYVDDIFIAEDVCLAIKSVKQLEFKEYSSNLYIPSSIVWQCLNINTKCLTNMTLDHNYNKKSNNVNSKSAIPYYNLYDKFKPYIDTAK